MSASKTATTATTTTATTQPAFEKPFKKGFCLFSSRSLNNNNKHCAFLRLFCLLDSFCQRAAKANCAQQWLLVLREHASWKMNNNDVLSEKDAQKVKWDHEDFPKCEPMEISRCEKGEGAWGRSKKRYFALGFE